LSDFSSYTVPATLNGRDCSGQVKTDSPFSNVGDPREGMRPDRPERRVPSRAVGEQLEVIAHSIARFLTRGLMTQSRALPCEAPNASFHPGMLPALTVAAHPTATALGRSALLGSAPGVRTATIRVMHSSRCGTASPHAPGPRLPAPTPPRGGDASPTPRRCATASPALPPNRTRLPPSPGRGGPPPRPGRTAPPHTAAPRAWARPHRPGAGRWCRDLAGGAGQRRPPLAASGARCPVPPESPPPGGAGPGADAHHAAASS
jgi:hypothetical protein